ncbi:His-Xaa-Ser system-associated MauG-like protein [Thioclava sp. GXIMD4215]|uniref:His-Xaa-Ser system-associated MauG-like protein n=1 Tax=Thioclava sp. GXIMD4215 TaxID=3131928 RepID=UPI00311AEDFA
MRLVPLCLAAILCALLVNEATAETLRERMLRSYALQSGLVPPEETWVPQDPNVVAVGQRLFESKLLSSERDTACASCHLDRFGSADGLPTAIGVEGQSFGRTRVEFDGDKLPRNALPLWGRGGKGFDTMFWDGRVTRTKEGLISQFGSTPPSDDPLVVAAHLPPLELGEMVMDRDGRYQAYEAEDVATAMSFAGTIVDRLRKESPLIEQLSTATDIPAPEITFTDVMRAVASFIAFNYRLQETRFHAFVFGGGALSEQEVRGGLVFYGKGQCVSCHNGPYFSDQAFHVIAFPQFGYGFNGFGTDYGRYNMTQDPGDLFRFRTAPLFNVTRTAPYSHSGSVSSLSEAIRYHVDPLAVEPSKNFTAEDRQLYARRIGAWAADYPLTATLDNADIDDLTAFLAALEYESERPVVEIQP